MDKQRRKELIEEYKQIKTYMGVIMIKNETNGKILVSSYPNLKNKWSSIQAQLDMGRHVNSALQKSWNELGAESFSYEVLEERDSSEVSDVAWEIKQMEKKWLEKLQPYGETGYNKLPSQA